MGFLTGNRKRWHDPAIRVEDVAGDVGRDAVDRVTDEIIGSHQDTGDEE